MFTTERLRFRPYRSSDSNDLLAMFNDARISTYITEGFVVPRDPKHIEELNDWVHKSLMFCMVETLDMGQFVGFSGIMPMSDSKNRNATFAIALLPIHWSKGYGLEVGNFIVDYAFRCLAMHRVSLTVFEGNDRALALYRKIGFIEEGRHRKIVWIDGCWRDTFFMGILEEEWAELKKQRQQNGDIVQAIKTIV